MRQRHIFLSSCLILLLGFFSTQGSLTGNVAREQQSLLAYDLTGDGVTDAADLRDLMEMASYGAYKTEADFNADAVLDQEDIDILASVLSQ